MTGIIKNHPNYSHTQTTMSHLKPIQATGTIWHVEVLDGGVDLVSLQSFTENFLETFEQKFSRFRSDSWLSELNRSGVFLNPDPEFRELLFQSVLMYEKTNGIFNIAVGEKMNKSGYDENYSFVEIEEVLVPVLTEVLKIREDKITLKNAKLDLGGIGKGFLIDSLARAYREEHGLEYFIINGGGDIYATSDHGQPISVTLTHPKDQGVGIGTVDLLNRGFASSSPFLRSWKDRKTDESRNHLHTENQVASYVVAGSVTEADVWATTLAIDPSQAPENVDRLLVQDDGVLHSSEIFKLNTN